MNAKEAKQIYLRAAEQIATGQEKFSCNAISKEKLTPARKLYSDVMNDSLNACELQLIQIYNAVAELDEGNWHNEYIAKNFRVMLLCMMAAAVEDLI